MKAYPILSVFCLTLSLGSSAFAQNTEQLCGQITQKGRALYVQNSADITKLEVNDRGLEEALRAYVDTNIVACVTGNYQQYKFRAETLLKPNTARAEQPSKSDSHEGEIGCFPPGTGPSPEWECDDGSW